MGGLVRSVDVNNHKVRIVGDPLFRDRDTNKSDSIMRVGQFHREKMGFDFISKVRDFM